MMLEPVSRARPWQLISTAVVCFTAGLVASNVAGSGVWPAQSALHEQSSSQPATAILDPASRSRDDLRQAPPKLSQGATRAPSSPFPSRTSSPSQVPSPSPPPPSPSPSPTPLPSPSPPVSSPSSSPPASSPEAARAPLEAAPTNATGRFLSRREASARLYTPAGHAHDAYRQLDPDDLPPATYAMQAWLYEHQHPPDCSTAKFLVFHDFYSGIGSQVRGAVGSSARCGTQAGPELREQQRSTA
jgi:hypothetical protein